MSASQELARSPKRSSPPPHTQQDATRCEHCAQSLAPGQKRFCCAGCRAVHSWLTQRGLDAFYERRGEQVLRAASVVQAPVGLWIDALQADVEVRATTLRLGVRGLQCAACDWLLRRVFEAQPGAHYLSEAGQGRLVLCVSRPFQLRRFAEELAALGYQLVPANELQGGRFEWRLGVVLALAGNVMLLSASRYLGLEQGAFAQLVDRMAFLFASLACFITVPVVAAPAWQALRQGYWHFDLPLALGLVLAYAGTAVAFVQGAFAAFYPDSVATFAALILLGRWLQQRLRERTEARSGVATLAPYLTLQRPDGSLVSAASLRPGDAYRLRPQEVNPLDACLEHERAAFAFDWRNGESEARTLVAGDAVLAGAVLAAPEAVTLRATATFADSSLLPLVQQRARQDSDRWWRRFSRFYVMAIALLATGGALFHGLRTGLVPALEVLTATCVVACPCALAIAVPLLRSGLADVLEGLGIWTRDALALDALSEVQRVYFDKTGTLTTPELEASTVAALEGLGLCTGQALATLARSSAHPKARMLCAYLPPGRPLQTLREVPHCGVAGRTARADFRLGKRGWIEAEAGASPPAAVEAADCENELVFARDAEILLRLPASDRIRPGAEALLHGLRQRRIDIGVLSGDSSAAVEALRQRLRIAPEHCRAGQSPEAKAQVVAQHPGTLFVGDGVNDLQAAQRATVSVALQSERPLLASRASFVLLSGHLSPLAPLLRAGEAFRSGRRWLVGAALAYNAVGLSLALAGQLSPWLAAILMPASSLVVTALAQLWVRRIRRRLHTRQVAGDLQKSPRSSVQSS